MTRTRELHCHQTFKESTLILHTLLTKNVRSLPNLFYEASIITPILKPVKDT